MALLVCPVDSVRGFICLPKGLFYFSLSAVDCFRLLLTKGPSRLANADLFRNQ